MVNYISFVVVNEYDSVPVFRLVVPTLLELVVPICVIPGITSVDIELQCFADNAMLVQNTVVTSECHLLVTWRPTWGRWHVVSMNYLLNLGV